MLQNNLVNFMIIGVQKCGTTSLAHQLGCHPDVDFCAQKEPDFFSKNPNWKNELADYHALYKPVKQELIRGEASTTYSWLLEYPETASRLYEYNPDLKFIYIVRDPVERIRSHYYHHYLKARTRSSFLEEVILNPTYINHSRYAIQIRQYLELFSSDNFYFLTLEDYISDSKFHLKKICKFLEISIDAVDELDFTPQNMTKTRLKEHRFKGWLSPLSRFTPLWLRNSVRSFFYHKSDHNIKFDDHSKQYLWRFVEDDIMAFEKISSLDLSHWRKNNNAEERS